MPSSSRFLSCEIWIGKVVLAGGGSPPVPEPPADAEPPPLAFALAPPSLVLLRPEPPPPAFRPPPAVRAPPLLKTPPPPVAPDVALFPAAAPPPSVRAPPLLETPPPPVASDVAPFSTGVPCELDRFLEQATPTKSPRTRTVEQRCTCILAICARCRRKSRQHPIIKAIDVPDERLGAHKVSAPSCDSAENWCSGILSVRHR